MNVIKFDQYDIGIKNLIDNYKVFINPDKI
jgi:hypothetical protein